MQCNKLQRYLLQNAFYVFRSKQSVGRMRLMI